MITPAMVPGAPTDGFLPIVTTDDIIVTIGVHDHVIIKHGDTVLLIAKDRISELKTLLTDERITASTRHPAHES